MLQAWNTAMLPNAKRPSLKRLLGDDTPQAARARGAAAKASTDDLRLAMTQWRVAMAGVHRAPPKPSAGPAVTARVTTRTKAPPKPPTP